MTCGHEDGFNINLTTMIKLNLLKN